MSGKGKRRAAPKAHQQEEEVEEVVEAAQNDKPEPKFKLVMAPSIAENKAKRARIVKVGQKVSDVISTGRNTQDLSEKCDWKKALSLENQAKWTLEVKKAKSENIDFMIRLCLGEETVSVYSPTLRVRSALINGVGVLSREDSKINQRKYKLKCIGAYDEELLLLKPEIEKEFNEFLKLMEQAKYTFYTLVVLNDLLYEAYITKYEEDAMDLREEWRGTTCRDNPDMMEHVVKKLVKESYTWDKGYMKKADQDPTLRFSRYVFSEGSRGEEKDEEKDKKESKQKGKSQDNKKSTQKTKQITPDIIRASQKNSSNQKGKKDAKGDDKNNKLKKLPTREECLKIIEEAREEGLTRTSVRVTNNTDGKIICPKGYEHDIMFNPLEQNDYIKVLFWFKPYWLSAKTGNPGLGMSLQFDNRGLVFMRKGKGRDEWTPFIKDTSVEAEGWSDEAFILREKQRAEKIAALKAAAAENDEKDNKLALPPPQQRLALNAPPQQQKLIEHIKRKVFNSDEEEDGNNEEQEQPNTKKGNKMRHNSDDDEEEQVQQGGEGSGDEGPQQNEGGTQDDDS